MVRLPGSKDSGTIPDFVRNDATLLGRRLCSETVMPQMQLPMFPAGVTHITPELAFSKEEGRVSSFPSPRAHFMIRNVLSERVQALHST